MERKQEFLFELMNTYRRGSSQKGLLKGAIQAFMRHLRSEAELR
ncbi:hypothetical protein [Paenibacillus pseudetheri]|uniref:Uncharacterized protein n=1 Tax=Paenibacillus pseudetheri TaxID=2897682 RepID=A0ABN8FLK1_9BACL|nr:hypothetical protein [Paenibacillus pseudetheri]CAH1058869.1 hypothetical protein PAECIP111894_05055 [Paenibacillus pseudetheri]